MKPRHTDLAERLREELVAQIYPLGAQYPTEHELQRRFGVGRHTIREALKLLTEQGLIGRRRKTGTTVLSHRPISAYIHTLRDFDGLMDFAQATRLEINHIGFVTAPKDLADDPAGGSARRWLRVAGRRFEKDTRHPLCWAEIVMPATLAPDRASVEMGGRPIYQMVMSEHGITLGHVEQEISATSMGAALAHALDAESHAPALVVRRRYVTTNGSTFEVSFNTYPANRYSVRSTIRKRI